MGYDQKNLGAGSPQATILPVRHWLKHLRKARALFGTLKNAQFFSCGPEGLTKFHWKEPAFGVVLYRLTSYTCIHCVSLRCPDVNRRKQTHWTWDTYRILIPLSFIQVLIPLSFTQVLIPLSFTQGISLYSMYTTCWNETRKPLRSCPPQGETMGTQTTNWGSSR